MKKYKKRNNTLAIRKRRKYLVFTGLATVLPVACLIGAQIKNSIGEANAIVSGQEIEIVSTPGGLIYSPELDALKDTVNHSKSSSIYEAYGAGGESLPEYYNSHDKYHTFTRTKNQHTEGLCWIYANSTALEYALEKNGTPASVSPKHIDYQFISADSAYKATDVSAGAKNEYYDRWLSAGGYERSFGDGGNSYTTLLSAANPYALMPESNFVNVLKSNDNRLSTINYYDDIWGLGNASSILTTVTSLSDPSHPEEITAYTEKQNYDDINNANGTDYIITGVGEINDPEYGAKPETVNKVKSIIQKYGAASVSSFFDNERCMDVAYDSSDNTLYLTIIDRTGSDTTCRGGHAMALIGWDDNWSYYDGDEQKEGAFIIQNSYGETLNVNLDNGAIELPAKYYMSYDSALKVMYYKSLESFDKYDHHYSISDYNNSTITPASDEYVFEFTSGGEEQLHEITFNQNFNNADNYIVYISTTGKAADFVRTGTFTAQMGMSKYEFETPINVSGDFAIKLKGVGNAPIEDVERDLNILNAYTSDGKTTYTGEVTWVQGEEYVLGSGEDLVIKVDYPLELLSGVTIDDEELNENYYKTELGSTIVTIYSEYLDTLAEGEHTISINYRDGKTVDAVFAVEEDLPVPDTSGTTKSPETGNGIGATEERTKYIAPALCVILAVSTTSVIIGYIAYRGKNRVKFGRK